MWGNYVSTGATADVTGWLDVGCNAAFDNVVYWCEYEVTGCPAPSPQAPPPVLPCPGVSMLVKNSSTRMVSTHGKNKWTSPC